MRFGTLIRIAMTPSCWLRVGTHSKATDRLLNHLMDEGYPWHQGYLSGYFQTPSGRDEFWTGNYPYGYGNPYPNRTSDCEQNPIPNRETVFRLHDYIHGTTHWTTHLTLSGLIRGML